MSTDRGVVPSGIRLDGVHDGPAHRVPDDRQHGDLLPVDRVEDRAGVHAAAGVEDGAAAAEHGAPRRPVAAHVHERAEGVGHEDVGHGDAHVGQRPQAGVHGGGGVVGHVLGPGDGDPGGHGGEEDVLVTPDHPLGVPGGPAGVGDVGVVGRPGVEARLRGVAVEQVLVGDGVRQGVRPVRAVLDHDQVVETRKPVPDGGHHRGEARLEDEHRQLGVVEEVVQLVGHVAVVDVDGHRPHLVGGHHRLEILGPAVHERAHVPVRGQSQSVETVGQAIRPFVQRAIGQPGVSPHHRLAFGDAGRHALEQVGQVELHGQSSPRGSASAVPSLTGPRPGRGRFGPPGCRGEARGPARR